MRTKKGAEFLGGWKEIKIFNSFRRWYQETRLFCSHSSSLLIPLMGFLPFRFQMNNSFGGKRWRERNGKREKWREREKNLKMKESSQLHQVVRKSEIQTSGGGSFASASATLPFSLSLSPNFISLSLLLFQWKILSTGCSDASLPFLTCVTKNLSSF